MGIYLQGMTGPDYTRLISIWFGTYYINRTCRLFINY